MQAAILCGGMGTRLKSVVADRPKPLAEVGGRPFLEWLVESLYDGGVTKLLLLTGYGSEAIERWAQRRLAGRDYAIIRESGPLGTAGALFNAWQGLDDEFYLLNGDTCFDLQYPVLARFIEETRPEALVVLRFSESVERYGLVAVSDVGRVTGFTEKGPLPAGIVDGYINAGVYYFRKATLERYRRSWSGQPVSLEREVLPQLAASGRLTGLPMGGFFIDIGIPEDYERAQHSVPERLGTERVSAAFLDRDGVLIRDSGYPAGDAIEPLERGKRIVRDAKEQGKLVVVVTNQAGIAKGKFSLEEYDRGAERTRLLYESEGLSFDAVYYCPYHPEAVREEYRKTSLCRKPKPGMILKACEDFRIDLSSSTMTGNSDTDRIELYGLKTIIV